MGAGIFGEACAGGGDGDASDFALMIDGDETIGAEGGDDLVRFAAHGVEAEGFHGLGRGGGGGFEVLLEGQRVFEGPLERDEGESGATC